MKSLFLSLLGTADVSAVVRKGNAVEGVQIVRILLQIQVKVPIIPPEGSRPSPQSQLLLSILPSHHLSHPVFIELALSNRQLSPKRTVEIERIIYPNNCKSCHLIALLEKVKHLQSRPMLFEVSLEDKVKGITIVTGAFAEGGRMLQRMVEVAIIGGKTSS